MLLVAGQLARRLGVPFHTGGALSASKLLDADLCGKISDLFSVIDLSDNGLALSAIADVGPGSHFLGSPHTLENFRTAFYSSLISDSNSFEQWEAEGSLTADQRANRQWKKLLVDYQDPGLDPAIDEALQDFISRRKESYANAKYY
ncbi:MAG: trimethylamine methyltransferase family protein [Gammaproteobacteria bacterium]|nr:trimethylamine methyltransferase family protein [Gammaproteobacteria bacterium]